MKKNLIIINLNLFLIFFNGLYCQDIGQQKLVNSKPLDFLNENNTEIIAGIESQLEAIEIELKILESNKEYFSHTLITFTVIVTVLVTLVLFIGGYIIPLETRKYYVRKINSLGEKYDKLFVSLSYERFKSNNTLSWISSKSNERVYSIQFLLDGLVNLFDIVLSGHLTKKEFIKRYYNKINENIILIELNCSKLNKVDFKKNSTNQIEDLIRSISYLIDRIMHDEFIEKLKTVLHTINKTYYN